MSNIVIDKDTHVYCTLCLYAKELIEGLNKDGNEVVPKRCENCYPWNPEDSFKFEKRPLYVPKDMVDPFRDLTEETLKEMLSLGHPTESFNKVGFSTKESVEATLKKLEELYKDK